MGFVEQKYKEFVDKNGYFPMLFSPYNCVEVIDICPTISTQSGTVGHIGNILYASNKQNINNKRGNNLNNYIKNL